MLDWCGYDGTQTILLQILILRDMLVGPLFTYSPQTFSPGILSKSFVM
jgi:hypothetical protein